MAYRILTIPFDPENEVFTDDELLKFLANKKVIEMHTEFFQVGKKAYWTVFVNYKSVFTQGEESSKEARLNEAESLLYKRLKEWRREKAEKQNMPVFIIATNKQLIDVIKQNPETIEQLKNIQGFGKKKLSMYGKELLKLLHDFYEKKPLEHKKKNDTEDEQPLLKTTDDSKGENSE